MPRAAARAVVPRACDDAGVTDPRIDDALAVLLSDELAPIVELVLCRRDGLTEAHGAPGSVGFEASGPRWTRGEDPLARQDAGAFAPLSDELASIRPCATANHYPFAYDNAAQLFDDPRAPDIAVVHTAAHNWEDRGGHRGEHGSLDVVQSRAPLILSGAGVRSLGTVEAAARMIDVAPTICALLDLPPPRGSQGRALTEYLDPSVRPSRVVAFLWDGTNANVLRAMTEAGELPAVAELLSQGTMLAHGLIASFPSVTLANHTTALTGVHPGRHGVLHNFYFDRAAGRRIVTNAPEVWHLARDEIAADAETLFEVVARTRGDMTAAVNEPVDRGARYATFDALRTGAFDDVAAAMPDPSSVPGSTLEFLERKREYAWSSAADHLAVQQATDLWSGAAGHPRPRLLWVNLILPDAANHLGGPYSDIGHAGLRDTDGRMGQILRAMDDGRDDTAYLLLADHGMEESDPACVGDWKPALARAGLAIRDEGEGFLYLM